VLARRLLLAPVASRLPPVSPQLVGLLLLVFVRLVSLAAGVR
jgi:hypothetical protein